MKTTKQKSNQAVVLKSPSTLALPTPDANKKYPVHLFLHGAGERGSDNELQLFHGSNLFLNNNNRKKYKSWVIFPQSPKNDWWGGYYDPYKYDYDVKRSKSLELVIKLMDIFIEREDVDTNKIYVSGLSMGGLGTFSILNARIKLCTFVSVLCQETPSTSILLEQDQGLSSAPAHEDFYTCRHGLSRSRLRLAHRRPLSRFQIRPTS